MSVLEAKDVSIRYITGDFQDIGLKEYIMRRLKGNYNVQEFWADRHVTFSLEKGDMLGIIGTNGAGKSTLLKAVSGIMVPSEGSIKVNGNIAALLELASGFDGDLTVKENTYLRGAMLGYTRDFMDARYEEIIAFAELQDFQERTFKQLSSGMKSRLAFSIACLVNPDILILDEVLSVGDGAFQKKSAERMRTILESGVTGILVSHSVANVRKLCNKILWLDHGKQVGFSDEVELYCNAYEEFLKDGVLPEGEAEIYEKGTLIYRRAQAAAAKQKAEEAKRLEELAKKKNEAIKKKAEADKKKAEAELQKQKRLAEQEALKQKRIAEQEERKAAMWQKERQEELKRAKEQQRLFNLQDLIANSNNKDLVADVISQYMQNCDIARLDIKNAGAPNNDIVIKDISDINAKVAAPAWYAQNGQGYVIESNTGSLRLELVMVGNGLFRINLRGRDVRYDGVNRLPVWIKYNSLVVDDDVIFAERQTVWHDAAYKYEFAVKDGQKVILNVDWDTKL